MLGYHCGTYNTHTHKISACSFVLRDNAITFNYLFVFVSLRLSWILDKSILARILRSPLALYRSSGPTAEGYSYVLDKIIIAFSQAIKLLCLHGEWRKTNKENLWRLKDCLH